MKKTAIIYSFKAVKTGQVARKIKLAYGENSELVDADNINIEQFLTYENLILGVPTWFDGELPNCWDEFLPDLKEQNLMGKKVAIFGNGDQKGYPENFCDAVGIMAQIIEKLGAQIIGYTSIDGYTFEKSKALKDGKFQGLLLDFENQANKNDERIIAWTETLKKEM